MIRLLTIAVSWAACVTFAQSGVLPYSKTSKLIITSCGPVRILGELRPDAAYVVSGHRGSVQIVAKSMDGDAQKVWLKPMEEGATATLEMKVPRGMTVIVESTGGDLAAVDIEGDVTAKTAWGHVALDRLAHNAFIKTGGGEVRIGRIGGELKCYSRGGSITAESVSGGYLETDGGEIFVRESMGPLVAKTTGGNIHIIHAKAGVEAITAGGVIDVQWSGGPVVAKTGGGSIQISAAKSVQCETGIGAIRLKNISGKVNAISGAGTILADLPSNSPLEDSVLKTSRGDVILMIPSNLSVTVKAAGRKVMSDFPAVRGESNAYGEIQGGGPLLTIEASGGSVFLRRKH